MAKKKLVKEPYSKKVTGVQTAALPIKHSWKFCEIYITTILLYTNGQMLIEN